MKSTIRILIILLTTNLVFCNKTLVESDGYPVEEHTVETTDGYILTLFRIPKPGKSPVFLQHGMHELSTDWFYGGKKNSLAYKLWNAGYDVWLGNARSSYYSKHRTYSNIQKEYWDFSFHEIGVYDSPAMIQYILGKTEFPSLHYVGYSEGTTAFFVMASMRPDLNIKVKTMQALSPCAYMGNSKLGFVKDISGLVDILYFSNRLLGISYLKVFDNTSDFAKIFADFLGISSDNELRFHRTTVLKDFYHYFQLIRSGKFNMLDFGLFQNNLVYQRDDPPEYNLTEVSVPVYLYYSSADALCTQKVK